MEEEKGSPMEVDAEEEKAVEPSRVEAVAGSGSGDMEGEEEAVSQVMEHDGEECADEDRGARAPHDNAGEEEAPSQADSQLPAAALPAAGPPTVAHSAQARAYAQAQAAAPPSSLQASASVSSSASQRPRVRRGRWSDEEEDNDLGQPPRPAERLGGRGLKRRWGRDLAPPADTFAGQECRKMFIKEWREFLIAQGEIQPRIPTMSGRPLDMLSLFERVMAYGGLEGATRKRRWRDICKELELPNWEVAGQHCKDCYMRYLYAYEKSVAGVHEEVAAGDADIGGSMLWNPDAVLEGRLMSLSSSIRQKTDELLSGAERVWKMVAREEEALADPAPPPPPHDVAKEGQGGAEEAPSKAATAASLASKSASLKAELSAAEKLVQACVASHSAASVLVHGGQQSKGRAAAQRPLEPLFRHGSALLCKGDCVTINTEDSDIPFVAQLLDYDKLTGFITVRWLYRCEEVENVAGANLQRFRKRWFHSGDAAFSAPEWNLEHEVFFSFHEDDGVHLNSVLNLITVYFTAQCPLKAQSDLKKGEYYCRSVWDPEEKQVTGKHVCVCIYIYSIHVCVYVYTCVNYICM